MYRAKHDVATDDWQRGLDRCYCDECMAERAMYAEQDELVQTTREAAAAQSIYSSELLAAMLRVADYGAGKWTGEQKTGLRAAVSECR